MEVETSADLVRCPSCHEEVPKTLYCLNCGYPLYEVEFEGSTKTPEEMKEGKREVREEKEVEGETETEAYEEVIPEEAERVEELEAFTPPPPLEEVLREVAKNLSIRIRMVRMLLEGELREEAFNRLLNHYTAKGERWLSERESLMERRRLQLEELEERLMEARMKLEELEIRKTIGDASEEEYGVKAPAYRWDVEKLNDEVGRLRREVGYLGDLPEIMGMETDELGSSLEKMMMALEEGLKEGSITQETYERAKASLEDILNTLKVK